MRVKDLKTTCLRLEGKAVGSILRACQMKGFETELLSSRASFGSFSSYEALMFPKEVVGGLQCLRYSPPLKRGAIV